MDFRFDHPGCLWLLLLAAPLVLMAWRGVGRLGWMDPARRWTAVGFRVAVLIVLTLMLAGLEGVRWHRELSVVVVADESESVRRFVRPPARPELAPGVRPPAAGADETRGISDYVRWWAAESSLNRQADDRLGLVTFDGRATVRAMPGPAADMASVSTHEQPTEGSNAAEAVTLGMAIFPPDSGKRMLLVGDGNFSGSGETASSGPGGAAALLEAARRAKAAGVVIDVLPLDYRVDREVMVEGVYAPSEARQAQTAGLRIVLRATAPTNGEIKLKHDGEVIDLNGAAPGVGVPISAREWAPADGDAGPDGPRTFTCVRLVDIPLKYTGVNRFTAIFEPEKGRDTMQANNAGETFTMVRGKGRVLLINGVDGEPGRVLPKALASHGVQLDISDGTGAPSSLAALQRYEAVILQNISAELVTPTQQAALARYVTEMGGGLVMVGGPDSFGAGGWTNSPIDRILPVDCQIPSQTVLPTGALLIVIDRSGSMAEGVGGAGGANKLQVACEAAVMAVQTLYPQDMIGVIAFDSMASWVVPMQTNSNPMRTAQTIRSISLGGGTDISAGLSPAVDAIADIKAQDAAVKHIILLTDGQSAPGPYDQMIGKLRKSGGTLSTVGVGGDVDANLLSRLALAGGGHYYPVNDAAHLPQVFIKEARSIRKNLIKEKPFNPVFTRMPSPITAGMRSAPQLRGLVLTSPKRDARVVMPMVAEEGEPLFAHWQVGLGRTAAFTSDATNRWAPAWLEWGGYADFWVRTLRAISRPSDSRQFDLAGGIEGDRLRLRLDAGDAEQVSSDGQAAGAKAIRVKRALAAIVRPDGTTTTADLRQTGPSVFEGAADAVPTGAYMTTVFLEDFEGNRYTVIGGASKPVGGELRDFASHRAVLEEVATLTGGRVLSPDKVDPGALFERGNVQPTRSVRPLWDLLLLWLLGLFLLDVAARRIAWNWGAVAAWFRRRLETMRATRVRGEEVTATLGALKAHAADRATRVGQPPPPAPSPAPSPRPAPQAPVAPARDRKFEADIKTSPASANLADAIGGARRQDDAKPATPQDQKKNEGPTTSRLLDAKRRAKERLDGDGSSGN